MTTMDLPTAPRVTHPETKPPTRLHVVETRGDMKDFQRVPDYVHWGDPYYIKPILSGERSLFDPEKHPFFQHGEARLWTAWHGHNQPVGRIAAFRDRDYDTRTGKSYGFFGYLDYMNDARVPEALLAEAAKWLREKGAQEIVGPCVYSASYMPRGLLVDGFDDDPILGNNYNRPNSPGFLFKLGAEKWFDEHGFEIDLAVPPPAALAAKAKEVAARDGLAVRRMDMGAGFMQDWETHRVVVSEAYRDLPRFVPVPKADTDFTGGQMKPLLQQVPEGALILEERGRPVGAAVAIADWNRVLKHLGGSLFPLGWIRAMILRRTIDRMRVFTFGVLGERGRARSLPLIHALWEGLHKRGYKKIHVGPIAEDNERALKLLEKLGAKRTHTWRMLKVPVGFEATTPARRA